MTGTLIVSRTDLCTAEDSVAILTQCTDQGIYNTRVILVLPLARDPLNQLSSIVGMSPAFPT